MSPNKNLKSPQKGSKRLKTAPFKVTLLDSAVFEGEIEVCKKEKQIKSIPFNSLLPLSLFSSVGGSVYFIVLWRIHKAAKQNQCESTMLRGTRREMQRYTPLPRTKKRTKSTCVVLSVEQKKDFSMFCPKGKIQDLPEKRKEQTQMHFILLKFWWNRSSILWKAALTMEDDWSLNDSPVKIDCTAKCALSNNSIWITDNHFRAAVLPST